MIRYLAKIEWQVMGLLVALASSHGAISHVARAQQAELVDASRTKLSAPPNQVALLAVSRDGHYLATVSAGEKPTLRWFDTESKKELASRNGAGGEIRCLAIDPQGFLIATGGADRAVRLWDPKAGHEKWKQGFDQTIISIQFAGDGSRLAVGGDAGLLRLLDVQSGAEVANLDSMNDKRPIADMSISREGDLLVVLSAKQAMRLFDLNSKKVIWKRPPQGDEPTMGQITISDDGQRIVAMVDLETVLSLDTARGELLHIQKAPVHIQNAPGADAERKGTYCLSREGRIALVVEADHSLRLWDTRTGKQLSRVQGHDSMPVAAEFSSSGNVIVTADTGGTIRVWDAAPRND